MPPWLGLISVIVGAVVFLGSVVVYFKGSADKGTIETLERNNAALAERVDLLEKSEGRLLSRVSALERENTSLLAQRPSAEVIAQMLTELTEFIASQGEYNGEVKTILTAIASMLRDADDDH